MIDHAVKTSQQDLPLFGPVIFEIEKERKALISCFERVMALGLSRLVETMAIEPKHHKAGIKKK